MARRRFPAGPADHGSWMAGNRSPVDTAQIAAFDVGALLFPPRRDRGQVMGSVPDDRLARRGQGGELGGGQGDGQRADVLLDA
jgi:hypothetical protein